MRLTQEKLNYLLYINQHQHTIYTMTDIAGRLGINKSTLSKVLSSFYQEGYMVEKGKIQLSKEGLALAKTWQEEIDNITKWLLETTAITLAEAKQEALSFALHMSQHTKESLLKVNEMHNFLYVLEDVKMIYGEMMSMHIKDGEYPFSFTLYKDQVENRLEISMSNEAFYHPGVLKIEEGKGFLVLHYHEIEVRSKHGKTVVKGTLEHLQYDNGLTYMDAKPWKDSFLIPIAGIEFYHSKQERILQGHLKLKMKVSVKTNEMPESIALLAIIFK
ncbi:hypothetical protein [Amedibacillus sp. YH-ame10]